MSFTLTSFFDSCIGFISKSYNKLELFAEKRKAILWGLVIFFCFGIILFLNVLTPMIADDFAYLYIFNEKEQVSSLTELIRSQHTHYLWWGGRTVVHTIAQVLLQLPSLVTDVLNSLMYVAFVCLIYLHIKGRSKEHSLSLFVLINLAVWFIIPMFGDTVLWITGSANYLWGTSIILLFLFPYRFYNGQKTSLTKTLFSSILMFLFGIVAGWTNENTVAGLIVIILLLFLYYRSQEWKIPPALLIGLFGILIGYAIMILAPGNFFRARHMPATTLYIILYRMFLYTQWFFVNYGVFVAMYIAVAVLFRFRNRDNNNSNISLIYLLGGIAAIYVMILSPQFPPRAWFGLMTYFIIALGILVFNLDYKELFLRQMRASFIFVGCVVFFFSLYSASKDINRANVMNQERLVIAQTAVEAGEEVCYFKRFIPHTSYVHGEDMESNMLLTYYYGIFVEYRD